MENTTISVQPTSNDLIVKFVANTFFTSSESFEFNNIDEASESPLAQQLFHLPFVKKIYVSQNFIAIERYAIVTWEDVQNEVAEQIENYLNSGKPVISKKETSKKIPVTVYAESTPNPGVLKFVANKTLVEGLFEFKSIDDTQFAPLPQALFQFSFVKEVFISDNYISVTKYDIIEWQEITLELREFIKNYIETGKPILKDGILKPSKTTVVAENENPETALELDDISKEIIDILNQYVKPAVASDGGNIAFKGYDKASKTVKVVLQGACSGCPSSTVTLKNGIENMLKELLNGKVEHVIAING